MAFLEKKLLSKKDLFILFGQKAGKKLYDLIYKCCGCGGSTYTVSLVQTNINEPTEEIIFSNGLNVTATYTYVNVGEYAVSFDKPVFGSPFDYATILNNSFYIGTDLCTVQVVPTFFNTALITSYKNGLPSDDVIGTAVPCIFEIKNFN